MEQAADKGTHQNVARVALILSVLAESQRSGLRLTDVVNTSGLGKTVAHRFLAGMVQHGLVDYDETLGRYFLGLKTVAWSAQANARYGLARIAEDALRTLARETGDTVYLMLRHGSLCSCVARSEGSFPIRTLTIEVGDRRPLGAGAGPLAILAYLPDPEIERVLQEHRQAIADYGFTPPEIRQMVGETRKRGYATIDNRIIPGMAGVAVPLRRRDGEAFAAINVVAISDRMAGSRREVIAQALRREVDGLQERLGELLSAEGIDFIRRNSLAAAS